MMRHFVLYRLIAFVLVLCAAVVSSGQQPATGFPPLGSFAGGPFDTVNLANLDVHLEIPVFSRPGRGISFHYNLGYDSLIWSPVQANGGSAWTPVSSNWGWRAVTEAATGYLAYGTLTWHSSCNNDLTTFIYSNITYHDPTGGIHPIPGTITYYDSTSSACGSSYVTPLTNVVAPDNSGYIVSSNPNVPGNGPATVNARGGITITTPYLGNNTGPGSVSDANGNQISISATGVITDTLPGTALTVSGSPTSSPMTYTYTAPGSNGQGTTATVYAYYSQQTVQTCFGVLNSSGVRITEFPATPEYLLSEIKLADGSTYMFSYEATVGISECTPQANAVTGRIASVTLPTGGKIIYSYTGTGCGNNSNCMMADGSPSNMAREFTNGTNIIDQTGTWTYTRAPQQGQQLPQTTTSVTDPAGNLTTMNFSGVYELTRYTYQGSSTLLNLEYMCYNGNYQGPLSSCSGATVTNQIMRRDVFEEPSGGSLLSYIDDNYDSYGNLLIEYASAYGPSRQQDQLIRNTAVTMQSSLCTPPYNICDHPQSVTIEDGGSNPKSYTKYYYDQGNNTHGSVTELQRSTSGTSSGPFLTSYYSYGSYGVLSSATDVNSTVTNYGYGSNSCSGVFPDSVSVTTTNPNLTFTYDYFYNCVGGVVTEAKDVDNGHWSGASYTDPYFWRPAYTYDLSGGQTFYNYYGVTNSGGSSAVTEVGQVESVLTNSSTSTVDQLTTSDAFGRLALSQTREGPSSSTWDTTEYLYNSSGQVAWATLLFQGSAGAAQSNEPAINYSYDGLGRYTDVDGSDWGGVDVHYSYSLDDVTVKTSPTPTQSRQYEYDPLGNLTSVCEITTATGAGCGQNNQNGTGYLTTYGYNALGNLTGVTQGANQAVQQTRSYSYDGLSRLIQESNPESGTDYYTYDSMTGSPCYTMSAGDLVEKVDAAGNATCFLHDQLHRLTDEGDGYEGSNAICRRFRYDNSNGVTGSTRPTGLANYYGRLVEAATDNCGNLQNDPLLVDEWFSYDARGGTTDVYQASPHSSGYYHVQAAYWPDGTVSSLNPNLSGIPSQTYGVDAQGGRIYSVSASSGQNPVTATTYNNYNTTNLITPVSVVTYGSGDSDTFAYDNMLRVNSSTYKVGSNNIVHTLGWNPNSTLASLAITDPLNAQNQQNCSYNYDALGRVAGGSSPAVNCVNGSNTVWQQSISYDPFGNITKTGSINWTPSYNSSMNQYVQGGGISYDANGNLLSDTFNTYTWDPNWGNPSSVNGNVLLYDALGRMVENTTSAGTREYLYGPGGSQPLAQMNAQTTVQVQYALPGGGLAIYKNSTLTYARTDWLNSVRLVTNGSQGMVNDSAYAPFGEQYSVDNIGFSGFYDFTGQQQWTVSGSSAALDDFPFRKYHPVQGRWITPDPAGLAAVDITNPQTWNRYAYVANNPLSNVDPLGLDIGDCSGDPTQPCSSGAGGGGGQPCNSWGATVSYDPAGPYETCGDFTWYLPIATGTTVGGSTRGTTSSGTAPAQPPINFPNETLGLPNGFPMRPWGILPALFPSDLPCPAELSSLCDGISPILDADPNAATSLYNNPCITSALKTGLINAGIDAIGFIPEAGGLARTIGHQAGYVGVVADQLGHNMINAVGKTAGTVNSAAGISSDWTSWVSAGITVGDFIPVVNEFTTVAALAWDTGVTAYKVYQCPK